VIELPGLPFDYEHEPEHEYDGKLHFPRFRITVSAPPATPREDSL